MRPEEESAHVRKCPLLSVMQTMPVGACTCMGACVTRHDMVLQTCTTTARRQTADSPITARQCVTWQQGMCRASVQRREQRPETGQNRSTRRRQC
jgi:hypothetical protein